MNQNNIYQLPKISFLNGKLWPYLSEEQVRIHYSEHHRAYVKNANKLLSDLQNAHQKKEATNFNSFYKSLTFNVSGHVLHSLYWENLTVQAGTLPPESLTTVIAHNFKNLTQFKQEFIAAGTTIEGSGWVALTYSPETDRLIILQIEKHQVNLIADHKLLLVVDVWEHAYYLDYQQRRDRYLNAIWEIINWQVVADRLKQAQT